jgi:hypothetical protein
LKYAAFVRCYSNWRAGLDCWQGKVIFLLSTVFRPGIEPTHPPTQCIARVKQPGCGGDHSTPLNAKAKDTRNFPICLVGVVLNEAQDQLDYNVFIDCKIAGYQLCKNIK